MPYSSRRRCGYCGRLGHTRVTCEVRKAKVERLRELQADGIWIGWDGRELLDQDDSYKARSSTPRAPSKCSYCYNRYHSYELEHNRRNCPVLAQDRKNFIEHNRAERAKVLQVLVEKGIGAGAVFQHKYWGRSVVTGIQWSCINPLMTGTIKCSGYDPGIIEFTPFESLVNGNNIVRYYRWHRLGALEPLIVPATERSILASVPEGWNTGETDISFYFKKEFDKHA